ncbi:hypothetical protein [Furfurilactobacillus rossiae]|uniref:Uncharacterized protein n=1 Tax=Furfurilactobacillus rossiae DSM 15814 TaxID=1114972 RepID=A0A0R1RDQ9_9LACO|nr:hypothetical protein [Furfurilactobacillus rossiae]KRL52306.1 hypothetical protein FD35_GL002118 [Furfurilactobacillus rossiae DSM 15814]QFR66792.1 hypothetical protein LR814_06640 [Furfurilactobacillus rossiae]QLE62277.1 hypothetical protein LROSRS0_2232 [Furfurilactobacillus rossiae]
MKNKIATGLILAVLPMTLATVGTTNVKADATHATTFEMKRNDMSKTSGAIVGSYNSKDKKVVGATLPGKSVSFKVSMLKGDSTYLHFAFMHAASGSKGWYFAPMSADGIKLSKADFKDGKSINITNKIGLFAAPDASTVKSVKANDGKLKYKKTSKFLKATVKENDGKYTVTIKNMSKGNYKTPFSSGVWGTEMNGSKAFDHTPSAALSKLATMGHRDDLLKTAEMK